MKCSNVWLFDNFCLFNCRSLWKNLEQSISVKIAKEAVMNINKPESLFKPTNGFLETKVYFAGVPESGKCTH